MKVLCIIGPSGAGKSAIVHELHHRGLVIITPTTTDRPRREGEIELEHKFVSKNEFDELVEKDSFIDTVQLFGLPFRYGLPPVLQSERSISLVMLRAPLINKMRTVYPDIVVYQIEAPAEVVKQRLKNRSNSEKSTRLSDLAAELELGRKIADRVYINDKEINVTADAIEKDLKQDF